MNKNVLDRPGAFLEHTEGATTIRLERTICGSVITRTVTGPGHDGRLNATHTDERTARVAASRLLAQLRTGMSADRIADQAQAAEQAVTAEANAIVNAAQPQSADEVIHLRREPNPIACGITGPVRVTRVFSEVTCQPCIDAEDRRQGRGDNSAYRTVRPTPSRVFLKPLSAAQKRIVAGHQGGVINCGRGTGVTAASVRALHDKLGGELIPSGTSRYGISGLRLPATVVEQNEAAA